MGISVPFLKPDLLQKTLQCKELVQPVYHIMMGSFNLYVPLPHFYLEQSLEVIEEVQD